MKAIDVHSMSSAIHSIFIVNSRERSVLKAFAKLESGVDECEESDLWDFIHDHTNCLYEINYRNINPFIVAWNSKTGELISPEKSYYTDPISDKKYRIIARFSVYGL